MNTFRSFSISVRGATTCLLLTGALLGNAETVYDSEGFEEPRFTASDLDGQDSLLDGEGPWKKDGGSSEATVSATNPIEELQSVRVSRDGTPSGDTRWGVFKPIEPTSLNNVVEIAFDMRVVHQALEFGPLFGVEAYDASSGSPALIGSFLCDASTGEILFQEAETGRYQSTGSYLQRNVHHHLKLVLDFHARTYSLHANGNSLHTSAFVDPRAVRFTDAPIATIAAADTSETGIAYFDNYRIRHTTSRLDYLVWRGDDVDNVWDEEGAENWHDGLDHVRFSNGESVVFDDSGSSSPPVELRGTLLPSSIRVSGETDYEFRGDGRISGEASLLKEGPGTLTINGPHEYSGGVTVSEGGLMVNNASGSGTGAGPVTVAVTGGLAGEGRVEGEVNVQPGGVMAPGAPVGTLSIENSLLLDGAVLRFDLGTMSDQLHVAGDLKLNGGLEVMETDGFEAGTYPLITYGGSLTLESFQIASAPEGYAYTVDTGTPGRVDLVVTDPPPPPVSPEDLEATAAGTDAIHLTWVDQSEDESGFIIERSENNQVFTEIAVTGSNVQEHTDTGLASATVYYYRVRATNSGGNSGYSNTASARTDLSPAIALYEFELNTFDTSGNNQHGAPVGTVLYDEGKEGDYAAVFDGTAFVEIPRVVEDSFTVAMWIRTSANASGANWYDGMGLVDGEVVGGTADWGCSILNSRFALGIGAPDITISSSVAVNDGRWRHVAATRDSGTGEVKLYVDGILDVVDSAATGPRNAPVDLRVGASQKAAPVFFRGNIDDLRFYEGVLNESEIAELAGIPEPPPPPSGDRVSIHPLGDSITWGYTTASAADSPGGYREPLYRELLLNEWQDLEFVGANRTNPGPLLSRDNQTRHDGYPQYTITEINDNLDSNAPTGKTRGNNGGFWLTGTTARPAIYPDYMLLLAGTNDIEEGAEASVIAERMNLMVEKIFELRPETKVFLASVPPYPADAAKTATAKAYNSLLANDTVPRFLSQGHNIRFVDQYANFILTSSEEGDVVNSALYGDPIHPNEAGYDLMGRTWAAAILADPLPRPETPTDLVAAAGSHAEINLSWIDQAEHEGAYLIERSEDGLVYDFIGYTGPDSESFLDTRVLAATTYHYRVRARNSTGDSDYSNVAVTTTPSPTPPPAPENLTASAVSSDQIDLSWTAGDGADSYNVKRSSTSGGPYNAIATGVGTTSYSDAGLDSATTYYYVVSAVNEAGEGANSDEAGATTDSLADAYGGRAFVLSADTELSEPVTAGDTGPLPDSGGRRETSIAEHSVPDLLEVTALYAVVEGKGDTTFAAASLDHASLTAGTNTIEFETLGSFAVATCSVLSEGSMVWGSSHAASLTVNGVEVEITGEPNQTVEIAEGRIVLNEQVAVEDGDFAGIVVNAARVEVEGGTEIVLGSAEAMVLCGEFGEVEECDKVTGGGWIAGTQSGERANFSVAGGLIDGELWGHLNYREPGTGMHVKHTEVTGYSEDPWDANCRIITYNVTIDGEPGTAWVLVCDQGEPGHEDTFEIELSSGYEAGGTLGGGDIQLHECR